MTAALTGTPGVGKTSVAESLRNMGYKVLDLNEFITERDLRGEKDVHRDTYEVDISSLKNRYSGEFTEYDIVESHMSHHLGISPIIILRCSPNELRRRVKSKGWRQMKIEENLSAEILDVILLESLEYERSKVYEIDTTDKTPLEAAKSVKDILEEKTIPYSYGKIDWSGHLD